MRFAIIIAILACLGWYKEHRDKKQALKKVFAVACLEGVKTTYEGLTNRSMEPKEIGYIGFTCERMSYKEGL